MVQHFTLLLLVMIPAIAARADNTEPSQPNVVLLVADDLGWTDLACFGSGFYKTPNIDRMAAGGMKFTSAYACPNCAPTRACLMTGLYPPRHGVYTVNSGARGSKKHRKLEPVANKTTLATEFVTIAEALKSAGYATAHFGKWHLGKPGKAGPREQGFDHNVGGTHAGHPPSYFSPYKNPEITDGPKREHLTDRLAREAATWIGKQKDRPFFAYVPFYSVHAPYQAKRTLVAEIARRPAAGKHRHPAYAAMIQTLDGAVGHIVNTIETLGATENTVLIFLSDNGGVGGYEDAGVAGAREVTHQAPLRGGKGMLYEGGVRVPMIARWPGVIAPGSSTDTPVSVVDLFPTLCQVAGRNVPPELDGVSLVQLLKNPESKLERNAIYWHFPGYLQARSDGSTWRTTPAGALRSGHWKLIEFFEDGKLELYDLSKDIGESRDLAPTHPEKRDELHSGLRSWRTRTRAPLPMKKKS